MKMLTTPPLADDALATSTGSPIRPAAISAIDDQLTAAWSRLSADQKRRALPILQLMVDHQNRIPVTADRNPPAVGRSPSGLIWGSVHRPKKPAKTRMTSMV